MHLYYLYLVSWECPACPCDYEVEIKMPWEQNEIESKDETLQDFIREKQRRKGLFDSVGEGDVTVRCFFYFWIVEKKKRMQNDCAVMTAVAKPYYTFEEPGDTEKSKGSRGQGVLNLRGAAVEGQTNTWRCKGGAELCLTAAWFLNSILTFFLRLNLTPHAH